MCEGPGSLVWSSGWRRRKRAGQGGPIFFFPHSPLYNQGCNQQRAKLPKFAGRSRRAAHQGRRARETNKDARKHTVKHRAKRDYILSFACTAKANAPERRLGWFWKCYNNTGARRAREGEALSGLFSFFFSVGQGVGGNKSSPSLPVKLLCVEGDLSCLL